MPRLIGRVLRGIAALFGRDQEEHDLDDELHAFLEAAIERHMAAGLSRESATRAARLDLGSIPAVKDHVRDAGWESRLEAVWQDVRYAGRGLRRSPAFACVATFTLALGVGANTTLFSVVNALLLRALPVHAPERLALVSTRSAAADGFPTGWNYTIWDQIRQRAEAFDGAVAWTVIPQRFDLAQGGEADPADGLFVSGDFFRELGVPALAGRTFTAEEDVPGGPESHVAVISYGFWQRRFGGAGDVVGRTLSVNRLPVTIVGVTPPAFLGPEIGRSFDIALPIGSGPAVRNDPMWATYSGRSYLAVMVRLRPAQSIDVAAALLRGMQRRIVEGAMPKNVIWGPLQDQLVKDPIVLVPAAAGTSELRRQYSQPLVTVLVIAALVLLIACVNLANLLVARATARQHELRVRLALGATRWRLVQQMLVESLLLSAVGSACGLALAIGGSRILVAQLSTWFERIALDVSIDWRVMAFTAGVAIATAVLFGIAPAVAASGTSLLPAPNDSIVRGGPGGRAFHIRNGLVTAQIALCLVLLIAAGLFIRTFERITALSLGFESERVLVASVNASRSSAMTGNASALFTELTTAIRAIPGVTRAAVSLNTPVNRGITAVSDFSVQGSPDPPQGERRATVNLVTPGWFETYGMAVKAGRVFDERDGTAATPVVVVNESFTRRFLPGRTAVGAYVTTDQGLGGEHPAPLLIVGVVGDAVDQSLRYGGFPTLYQPWAQFRAPMKLSDFSVSVRAASRPPVSLARSIAAALSAADRNLAFSLHPLSEQVGAARQQERLVAWLSSFFGGLALVLAAIGVYGVTSYAITRRRTEISIRMALGARRWDVVRLAIRNTVLWSAAGVVAGLVAAAALTRYVERLLFGVTPLDAATFIDASSVLVAVALLACYLPARRATSIDPMIAIRTE